MLNKEKTNKQLYRLFDSLLSVGYYDLYSSAAHLIFLKYLISYSDRLNNLTIDSYKALTTFKRKYDNAKAGGDPLESSDLSELFSALDRDYVFNDMRLGDAFRKYDEIFRDKRNQRNILQALDDVDFESDKDFIGDFFELLVQECSRDARMTGESVTSKSLRELAAALLNVTNKDKFLNCFSGFSSITLNIKDFGEYTGYEINPSTFAVSKMLLTMRGMSYAKILNEDFLTSNTHETADKVFSDGPIAMKYDNPSVQRYLGVNTRDADLLILYKVLDSVKDGGTAVITVPSKVLFSESTSYKEMRKKFIRKGLKAVISLPALWSGTSINTNILVVQKGYDGNIEFIDARDFGTSTKNKNVVLLSPEEITRIVDTVNQELNVENFAASASRANVDIKGNWQPNNYISYVVAEEHRDIKEIDKELESLYAELRDNLK